MSSEVTLILVLILGLLGGLAIGWFVGTRPLAELRERLSSSEVAARGLDDKFKAAIRDLAAASERADRADQLTDELAVVRQRSEALGNEIATLRANAAHFDEQKRLLLTAQ